MKLLALLISMLVVGSQARKFENLIGLSVADIKNIAPPQTTIINDRVDEAIPLVNAFLKENGRDPMPLPDTTEGFEVQPLLVPYSALLHLNNGRLYNLASARRDGDATAFTFANLVRIRIAVDFRALDFTFDYEIRVMGLGPTGGVVGDLDTMHTVLELMLDQNNNELHIQDFIVSGVGNINVRLTGNPLTDWLYTPVMNLITTIFRSTIVGIMERNIRNDIQNQINIINANNANA